MENNIYCCRTRRLSVRLSSVEIISVVVISNGPIDFKFGLNTGVGWCLSKRYDFSKFYLQIYATYPIFANIFVFGVLTNVVENYCAYTVYSDACRYI